MRGFGLLLRSYTVTGGRLSARKVRSKGETRFLVGFEVSGVGQCRDGGELALIEAGERGVDHVFRGHDPLGREVGVDVYARLLPQRSCSGAGQHYLDGDSLVCKLILQSGAEILHEGFAAAVNAVQQLGREGYDGADVDDEALGVLRKVGSRRDSEPRKGRYVELNDLFEVVRVGVQKLAGGGDAGIVDKRCDRAVGGQAVRDAPDVGGDGKIGL